MSTTTRTPVFRPLGLTLVVMALLWSLTGSANGQAITRKVNVNTMSFEDEQSAGSTSTIKVGDSIQWVWVNGFHTTTSGSCTLPNGPCNSDGIWDASIEGPGQTFTRLFDTPGTFPYYCTVHGVSMRGTVVVQATTAATTTVVTTSGSPSVVGSSVTFTATVTSGGGTPAGNVTFKDGGVDMGAAVALNGSGVATLSTSSLTVGTHSIAAVYAGNGSFTGSTSGAISQVVNKITTNTALQSSANPSTSGQAVTFTATVTNSGAVATGSVSFRDNGVEIGTGTLSGSAIATFQTSALAQGSHPITAVYAGDSLHLTSTSGTVNQTVNAPVPSVSFQPTSLDFGGVAIHRSSLPRNVSLSNGTANPVSTSSLQITGDYAYVTDCGPDLAAGSSCNISVVLTPQAMGTRLGQLSLDGAGTVSLTGAGVEFSFTLTRPQRPPRN